MCRHLGWLGADVTVSSLVLDPPCGLRVQSYAPRRQKHGLMNADGWGVGFFDSSLQGEVPRRWRSAAPLWGDASFASVAPALRSHCVVAAVRSATVGMPIEPSATAPFTDGQWLLSHNGVVDCAVLPLTSSAESVCDSAILAAVVFERGLDALGDTIAEVGMADPRSLGLMSWPPMALGCWPPPGATPCPSCAATTVWCWPASRMTMRPTGRTCRTGTWLRSPRRV